MNISMPKGVCIPDTDPVDYPEGTEFKTVSKSGVIVYTKKINGLIKIDNPDGPAIIYPEGDKFWYKNGSIHREDGPAVITEFYIKYLVNGQLSRLDGPAIKNTENNSRALEIWSIHGCEIDEIKYKQWLIDNGIDINNLTEEDKQLILLAWR